ncbi:hypothetical protein IMSHALPRED_006724 [Imshaugia aleurites]|uniref:Uncharacterized protein n=1 Tax=Imshaugia aleurites TaxID=172621 RepID=A0A8H3ILS2_9LECA|nr:hypothetical protein IMSHALPRED_006724 [Imshaugia aleurites]
MHLPDLTTLVLYLLTLTSASPIAWPDDKLEEINALRARGVSELDIATRFPRPLTSPSPSPPPLAESDSLYAPTSFYAHATDTVDDEDGFGDDRDGFGDRNCRSKVKVKVKRRFTEAVGRRGGEITGGSGRRG